MKSLIVEDDFTSRNLMQIYLADMGPCHVAVNGREAVEAVTESLNEQKLYDLICLDIMMPEMDGIDALAAIRKLEKEKGIEGLDGVKVIMTTAKGQSQDIFEAFNTGCEAYLIKPVRKPELIAEIQKLGLTVHSA
ncbi:MAG TPA: response regulator [Phycisphaerales bacterium]|nr:response regulator [Phycisphaerales bacterium]